VPKPPGKNDQSPRQIHEPVLTHEEVVELEGQARVKVAVVELFVRQADGEAHGLAARFPCAAIGGLHEPRSAARANDVLVAGIGHVLVVPGEQIREAAAVHIILGQSLSGRHALPDAHRLLRPDRLELLLPLPHVQFEGLGRTRASRTEEYDGTANLVDPEPGLRFEVLGQNAQRAGLRAVQKLAIIVSLGQKVAVSV